MNQKIRSMTGVALLMALVVVLQLVGGMIPPVGGFTISLVLIPIVLGAALYGPKVGALLGAVFGVMVVIGCITGSDAGGAMVFQANPLLCILVVLGKGTLAGFLSGVVYALLKGRSKAAAMLAAAVVCPVVNTGTFLVCMAAFFMDVLAAWAGGGNVLGYVLSGLVLCNFVPELVVNVLFSTAGTRILRTLEK
ncbi:MAG: ECF transporter S component [Oscillospiraceae bacterium]|nr:ECF transporter S component [Oscillospiraceae bacterium]